MMVMRNGELKQGDLENLILNALWDLEQAGNDRVYVADVQLCIRDAQRDWAYTTVKTVMDRLVEKGLASRIKEGKKFYYSSVMSREEAGMDAVRKVVRQYFKHDLDGLQVCVAALRREGFGIEPATADSVKQLERSLTGMAL